MHKLYLVEGIPGAGKTTTAREIAKNLREQGLKVHLYEEGMSHPADCAWQAFLTKKEYEDFCELCSETWEQSNKQISKEELLNRIEKQVRREDDKIVLAYTKIEFPEEIFWNNIGIVASKELGDGRSNLETFRRIHLKRWRQFAMDIKERDVITIFECAFLQNHIFELMGVYEKSDDYIVNYLRQLIETVEDLDPLFVYIKPHSIEKVINQAANERKAPNPYQKDWIDEIAEWVSRTNYGKHNNLFGREGVIQFCTERLRLDQYVLNQLNIPVTYVDRV